VPRGSNDLLRKCAIKRVTGGLVLRSPGGARMPKRQDPARKIMRKRGKALLLLRRGGESGRLHGVLQRKGHDLISKDEERPSFNY